MTAKKVKDLVKKEVQLTLENVKVGMVIPDLHGVKVKVDKDLIEQMCRFEKDSNQNAIWKGKVTGGFLYFKYYEDNPEVKQAKKKSGKKPKAKEKEIEEDEILEFDEEELEEDNIEELEEAIEETTKLDKVIEEAEDEEDLILDAIEDYKTEYNVKTVNTNSKKFKAFFEKWKQDN